MPFCSVLAALPIACLFAALSWSSTASAEPVTVEFSGIVDEVTDPLLELPAGVVLGAPFSGSFTIDPDFIFSTPVAAPIV